ncbi:hypothetical protein HN992_01785 [Candidatus Woesearchaeota archaeon]|jgi:hypothetical protein|nr:hypothetical protein [Candidatus Woesearchaeota archaeon]MBT3438596.1 hypothetical protein [Candidatus Woesearchaeota archaeon]MBT4058506.1 hypothetical protein [Candidatus Woesearchaeota archaeon]MBT4207281.1 hypothetical protein [Candidatus Woesearchaeota archaeon]MBT4733197.1 hypothetical protein [Candidatus Woesearchaeota archaeon]
MDEKNLEGKIEIDGSFMKILQYGEVVPTENTYLYSLDFETNLPINSITRIQPTFYEEIELNLPTYCSACEISFYKN